MYKKPSKCKIYLITPPRINKLSIFKQILQDILPNPMIDVLQLRLKKENNIDPADPEEFLRIADHILPICEKNSVSLIINDYPDLVSKTGANGVHVGVNNDLLKDGYLSAIREQIGDDKIIGASCYNLIDYAVEASRQSVNYVAFGAFYPTLNKPHTVKANLSLLTEWQQKSTIPSVAIGGLNQQNSRAVIESGADYIALISSIWDHKKGPRQAIKEFGNL